MWRTMSIETEMEGRAGQGRAGQGRAGQGRAGQGRARHGLSMTALMVELQLTVFKRHI